MGRNVEVARHEQAVVPHVQDLVDTGRAQRIATRALFDNKPERVAYRLVRQATRLRGSQTGEAAVDYTPA